MVVPKNRSPPAGEIGEFKKLTKRSFFFSNGEIAAVVGGFAVFIWPRVEVD